MKVELSRLIRSDLRAIGDYIARHNPRRTLTFVREFQDKFLIIAANPEAYRLRSDLDASARIAPHGRYVILFRILPDRVRIERVVSGYRDLPRIS